MQTRVWVNTSITLLLTLMAGILCISGCGDDQADGTKLSGSAEDLWGATIDFDTCMQGVTVISPFSPAT